MLLADFASFKPVYLPDNNPSDFNYFFDTSRRRMCYIAPERFLSASVSDTPKESVFNEIEPCFFASLTPEMDIFSTGCVFLELWNDGVAPFDYSQLLAYRNGDTEMATKHIQAIDNLELCNLVTSMIDIEPTNRKPAEIYLSDLRGKFFPEFFYSFLQSIFQLFSSKSADDRINSFYPDIEQIIDMLQGSEGNENGTILIVNIVTSCVRGLLR